MRSVGARPLAAPKVVRVQALQKPRQVAAADKPVRAGRGLGNNRPRAPASLARAQVFAGREWHRQPMGLCKPLPQRVGATADAAPAGDGFDEKWLFGLTKGTWQKVVPLAMMFFCILFNYTILRDTKVRRCSIGGRPLRRALAFEVAASAPADPALVRRTCWL